MARKRMIDPDFWIDEKIGSLSMMGRLLFIGMWNLSDDEGLLRFTPEYLKSSIFPYDNISFNKVKSLMNELEKAEFIFSYIGGKNQSKYAFIINFGKYQTINRPQPSKLPPPSLQNIKTIEVYAKRDAYVCHICKERVELTGNGRSPNSLLASPDHIVPKSKGGNDYPSNIHISHVKCNKARCNRDIESVNDSVNESVNIDEQFTPNIIEVNLKESEVEVEKEVKEKEPPPQQQTTKLFAIWGRIPDNGERSKTDNLLKQFGWKPVWEAFHRASEMGKEKKNVAYVRGILTKTDRAVDKFSRGIGAG